MKKVLQFPNVRSSHELNEHQLAAIQNVEGLHCINSGAGTGKSAVLCARLQRIHTLYPDSTVLMLAFTKAAALELKERVGNIHGVTISTIHSLSYHILKSSAWNFSVEPDADQQVTIIADLIGNRSIVTEDAVVKSLHTVKGIARPVLRVRQKFLRYLKENHLVTFDTLPIFALSLLKKHSGLRTYWQYRYDFIQIDEAQDFDTVQVALIRILSAKSKNLCLVGDSRQQIFGFRGASGAMEEFGKIATNHSLCFSYRCNSAILTLANSVMAQYPPLIALSNLPSLIPQFWTAKDSEDETKKVVSEILTLVNKGYSYKDIAIVYRSSSVTTAIFQELLAQNIPLSTKSPLIFKYNSQLWRTVINLLKFLDDTTSLDKLEAILPIFYLKKSCITDIRLMVAEQKFSLVEGLSLLTKKPFHHDYVEELATAIEAAKSLNPARAIRHLLKHGLSRYFGEAMTIAVENVISELQQFPTIAEFLHHVQTLKSQIDTVKEFAAKTNNLVQLMTIHTAKGSEFKCVFLIGAYDGILPSDRDDADTDEEKRLLYVAITRAKERLYITYPKFSENSIEMNKPCRFLAGRF